MTRDSFVEHFGEGQARAVEAAAAEHRNGINDRVIGSDPFRWAICICIGYDCMKVEDFRSYHNITAPWEDIKAWIIEHGDIANHDGDMDYLGLFAGSYDEYIPKEGVPA